VPYLASANAAVKSLMLSLIYYKGSG